MQDKQVKKPNDALSGKAPKEKKPQTKGKKIFNIVSTVITAVVALLLCVVAILAIVQRSEDKSPSIFGYYMFTVLTDSMEPTIMTGDVILSKKAVAEELKEGDIITYRAQSGVLDGHNLTHRIVRFVYSGDVKMVITQGDNASGEDAPIEVEKVTAVYVKTLGFVGDMLNFLKTPAGFVCIIVLPLLAVLVLIIISFFRDKLKLEREEALKKAQAGIAQNGGLTGSNGCLTGANSATDNSSCENGKQARNGNKSDKTMSKSENGGANNNANAAKNALNNLSAEEIAKLVEELKNKTKVAQNASDEVKTEKDDKEK